MSQPFRVRIAVRGYKLDVQGARQPGRLPDWGERAAVFRRQVNGCTRPALLVVRRSYTRMVAGYQTNRGAAYSLGYHVVWCPKYRRPVLVGSVADRLRGLIGQKCDERGWSVPALEVMPDHVHLFVRADPTASPSYVANQLKGFTSRTLRDEFPHLRRRLPTLWSRSYFVSSVGNVSAATIEEYIETQWERPWRKSGAS